MAIVAASSGAEPHDKDKLVSQIRNFQQANREILARNLDRFSGNKRGGKIQVTKQKNKHDYAVNAATDDSTMKEDKKT